MRLFISVNLPEDIALYLKQMQTKIGQSDAKMAFPSDLHITLKFLGETGDNEAKEIVALFKQVKMTSFKANLSNVGIFPNETKPRVIWVGAEPEKKFNELFLQIEKLTSKFSVSDHDFKPHITLSRIKFVKDRIALKQNLENLRIDKKEFSVDSFYLMKSTLTPTGPVYEVVEKYSLS